MRRLLGLALFLTSASAVADVTLLHNASIHTMDADAPKAETKAEGETKA